MIWLRDLYQSYIKSKAVLYTTDSCEVDTTNPLSCGSVAGVFETVDVHGWTTNSKYFTCKNIKIHFLIYFSMKFLVSQCFKLQGPPAVTEYHTGLPGHWGELPKSNNITHIFIKNMKYMLALNASVNIYMFHGGTNFGFTSGSYSYKIGGFYPVETTYDFNSPLNESGDPTELYFEIKKLLKETVSVNN